MLAAKLLSAVVVVAVLSSCDRAADEPRSGQATPAQGAPRSSAVESSADSAGSAVAIRITFGSATVTGHLNDTSTARALAARLPLTLPFRDLLSQEKISPLSPALPTDGVPRGDDPAPGDIGYWIPDGNLVLYYGDVSYWDGIVRIGSFEGGRDVLRRQQDGFQLTIELAG